MTLGAVPTVVLVSGTGSNMRVLAEHALRQALPIQIRAVLSDKPAAPGLAAARELGIPAGAIPAAEFPDRAGFDAALADAIEIHEPRIVVLAGFMRILGKAFVQQFIGRMLNIHPSLLPAHRGLHTHRRVLANGERLHGASVHFVTHELDGGPVILQGSIPVRPDDTEQTLAARVQTVEHRIYPQAVHWLAAGRLQWNGGCIALDGRELAHPVIQEMDG